MLRKVKMVTALVVVCLFTSRAWSEPQNPDDTTAAAQTAPSAQAADFRMLDEFDGKLTLDWKPLRPDPSHFSLTKHPGKLAITTQFGSMHMKRDRPQTKNVFLLDNPSSERTGFVATVCLESFEPTTNWHQAGLMLFDDEDNYLKFVVELNNHTEHATGVGPIFNLLREVDGGSSITKTLIEGEVPGKLWLRLTTRGSHHEYATSTDGETFTVHGELPWGDGSPKQIGLMATNGSNVDAKEIDAQFDSFELRSLTPTELNEPRFVERGKLAGPWKVKSCQISGKSFEDAPLSRFVFAESKVTIVEKERALEAEYTLDISKEPKQLTLSSFLGQMSGQVRASYFFEGDALSICFALRPGAEAPDEFETKKGDGRLLVTLERVQEE